MLKTKYEYNFYSFYDHTGMEQHFEKMAAQGWLIEKLGYFWRYRRIGPLFTTPRPRNSTRRSRARAS